MQLILVTVPKGSVDEETKSAVRESAKRCGQEVAFLEYTFDLDVDVPVVQSFEGGVEKPE